MPVFDPQRFQQFKETGVLEAPVFSPEKLEQFKETGQLPITPEPAGVDLTTPPKVTSGEIDTSQWIKSKPETTDIPPDTVILSLSQKPEGIDPVMKTIMLFEAGPVARRNKNPGNVQYTKELGEKFQAKKGEAYTDSTGAVRYHAVFPSEELGIAATRFIANNIWERAGKDPVKFASIYTGLPEGSNTVHNYAKSIQSNLKGRVVPPVIKEEWEPEEKPVYIPYKAITGETHYYRVPTQEETLAKQVKEDGLVEQAIKNTLYRGADIFLFGGGKRLFEAPALTQLLDLHIAKTGFFKDNPTMQIARVLMGMGEASGTALSFMAPSSAFKAIGLTGKLASAATFSTVGGLRRVLDPDIQKGMTWDKWVVGTSLDAVLGAVFPWLGKLGGSVLEQPSTVKAFGQFLLQSGAISTAMDATSFTETFYGALRDNPDKKALDVFNEVATQFISHPEQLVKNFATMAFLHSTSVGFRFLKGGKLFAEQQATFIKQMGDMAKELPEWTRKAPQTMQEAQRFYNTWMDVTYKRMLNVSEAADFLKKQRLVREKQAEQVKRTQKQMAEAKERKKAVEVPVTGEEKPYATREDIIKMPTVQQIETLEDMGYHIDHIVRMSGEQRAKAVANKVAPTPGQRKPLPAKIKAKPIEMKPEPRPEEVIQPEEVKPKPVEEAPEKPPEVKPEAPPPEPGKVAETLETVRLNPKDVKTREDWFQPKTEYRQWVIDSIAEEFDPIEWKEPLLWRDDPGMGGEGTGNLIVARGHHRQKGVEKGRYADVPYKILPKGTTLEQARRIAESEPLDIPTDFENAGSVRRRLEAGDSITQIVKDMPQVAPKAKTDESRKSAIKNIANLAYLDPAGMFAEVYDLTSDFPKIVSISKWVGSLRKSYPWMTNTHEKDLFKFFYTERGAAKGDILDIKKKIKDGLEKMNGMPGDKPARLDWLHKGIVTGIEATHPEIAQEIKVKQQTLTRIRATLSEEDLTQETRKSLETDAAMLEKEITSMQEDVGRAAQQQETLFSIQRDIFGGEAQAEPTLTEAERLRQEEQREYGAQRQREQEFIEQRAKEGKLTETTADVLRKQLQAERTRELEEAGQESIFGEKSPGQEEFFTPAQKDLFDDTKVAVESSQDGEPPPPKTITPPPERKKPPPNLNKQQKNDFLYVQITNFIRNTILGKPREISPEDRIKALDMLYQWNGDIKAGLYHSNRLWIKMEKVLTEQQRNDVLFLVEGTPDMIKGKVTPEMDAWAKRIEKILKQRYALLKSVDPELGFVSDYIPHIWDIPRKQRIKYARRLQMRTPFQKERRIPTIKDGLEMGFKLKYEDTAKILRIYDQHVIRTVANIKLAKNLMSLTDESGNPLIMRIDKAPEGWRMLDHYGLRKAMAIQNPTEISNIIHPDLKGVLKELTVDIGKRLSSRSFAAGMFVRQYIDNERKLMMRFQKKFAEDVPAHETGHFLDSFLGNHKEWGLSGNVFSNPIIKRELRKVIQSLGLWNQEFGSLGYHFRRPKEQIAEFMSLFLRDPKKAAKIAPTTFDLVRRQLIQHPELKNLLGYDFANRAIATLVESATTIHKMPVKVHPDIYPFAKAVFENPFNNAGVRGWQVINAIAKKSALSVSFFHHLALTESAIASGIMPFKFYKGVKLIRNNPQFTEEALKSGLEIGAIPDVQIHIINNLLRGMERRTRNIFAVNKVTKGVRKANELWDKALWDYYHTGLKMHAFQTILSEELAHKKNQGKPPEEIARKTAKFVNDAFGGQNWELLLKSPKWRQVAQWSLLAPDWTISNLRIFGRAFQGDVEGRQGRKYWIRAALSYFTFTEMLNYVFSLYHDEEGRFTWDNSPGHEFDIFTGYMEDDKGRKVERFLRIGKQFREPFKWATKPLYELGVKMSPMLQISIEQLTKHSTTGFPTEFAEKPFEPEKTTKQKLKARAKSVGEKFVPFAVRGQQYALSVPTSKGITGFKAIRMFEKAIKRKNKKQEDDVRKALKKNNYTSKEIAYLYHIAKNNVLESIEEPDFMRRKELNKKKRAGTITYKEQIELKRLKYKLKHTK